MEISINWAEAETVNYPCVLIKGSISGAEPNGTVHLTNGPTRSSWPLLNSQFKCLSDLTPGWNTLQITYGTTSKTTRIRLEPNTTDLCVVPLYIVCAGDDGRFQAPPGTDSSVASACRRISIGSRLVQCLFAEKLKEKGFLRRSFQLESDLTDAPEVRVFQSLLTVDEARGMDHAGLWESLAREIMTSEIGNDSCKYLAFLSCTHWDGEKVVGDPALGGGGLALLGSACLHTWPETLSEVFKCFNDGTPVGPNLLDNSCYRGTYGGCFSTSLGSVCHEMGHMFNLGHTHSGIMSRGFDHIERVFLPSPPQIPKQEPVLLPCFSVSIGSRATSPKSTFKPKPTKEDDLTYLTESCAAILDVHPWFNRRRNMSTIKFDSVRGVISSEAGLKVIQLRGPSGIVLKTFQVGSKAKRQHFVLPRLSSSPVSVLAIDSTGCIFNVEL